MAYQVIYHEFMQVPPVTRAYVSTCVLTTIAIVKFTGIISFESKNN